MLPLYAALYEINTRVWLTDLSKSLGRPATLDDISDAQLDSLAEMGFDWIWLLSVWQTGPAAQAVSRANPEWQMEDGGYDRDGSDLQARGLYLDAPPWQASVFALTRKS